jgi:putative PIN family toxin of toxin-antitoxin system
VYPRIVIDTSVLIAGLRNRLGPSQRLLRLVGEGHFETALSVPLFLEYQEVSKRLVEDMKYTDEEIDIVLDYLCQSMQHYKIDYLWRPFLKDGDDDMVLELAVASNSRRIVTYNIRDFQGCEQFGITAVTPEQFLTYIRSQT